MKYIWFIGLLVVLMLMTACGEENAPSDTTTVEATGVSDSQAGTVIVETPPPEPQATRTPQPTSTPSPTPAPPAPSLSIADQPLDADGLLIVEQVISLAPGWVVVYADDDGEPGEIIGYTPVPTGESNDVTIEVDPYLATPNLHLLLHADEGLPKEFDYPGPDDPFTNEEGPIAASFAVDIGVVIPVLSVQDQDVGTEGQVIIRQVVSDGPGWVAIHADRAGEPGPIIGQTPLLPGDNNDVVVTFNWLEATHQLHAILYEDVGEPGMFEAPDTDRPVVVSNMPVRAAFEVTLPPDVFVINQPIVEEQVTIERVVVNGPSWLTVYNDIGGQPSLIIGQVLLEPGVNTGIVVPVDSSAATAVLYVVLYEDNDPAGEFNFPGNDQAVRYEGRLQTFSFRTEAGNYLITIDQQLGENGTVLVPLVVTEVTSWVTVQADEEGVPGAVLGWTWIPAGVHRGVVVEIDPEQATDTLHITLFLDTGVEQEFEYPDGPDVPLQRNRALISAPFILLPPEDVEQ